MDCEVFDLMFSCWNRHFNGIDVFKHACLQCVCVSRSVWFVRLALFTLSPPSPDSSLGMTAITHMPEQLRVRPAHFPYSSEGRKQAAALTANKPLFSHQSSDKGLGLNEGMKRRKLMGERAIWTERGVNKASLSLGRSHPRGRRRCLQSWGTTAEMNHELDFFELTSKI